MRAIVTTLGPLAVAVANGVALSQTLGATGPFTLNGSLVAAGVAVFDAPRRVGITSAGNDSGVTFTVSGTDRTGAAITEAVKGANVGTASTVQDFATVTSVTSSGATAAGVTIGTTSVASTRWIWMDTYMQGRVSVQAAVTGTVNYTVEMTSDDPNSQSYPLAPGAVTVFPTLYGALTNATANQFGELAPPPSMMRLTLNSGTGSVKMTVQQLGSPPV